MPNTTKGNSNTQRNYAIDAIKIIFAVSVAMGHFHYGTFIASNTVVQVFFILSGYFLMQSYRGGAIRIHMNIPCSG